MLHTCGNKALCCMLYAVCCMLHAVCQSGQLGTSFYVLQMMHTWLENHHSISGKLEDHRSASHGTPWKPSSPLSLSVVIPPLSTRFTPPPPPSRPSSFESTPRALQNRPLTSAWHPLLAPQYRHQVIILRLHMHHSMPVVDRHSCWFLRTP